jgi:serine/threonine protein kinase
MISVLSHSKRSILYKQFSDKEGKEVVWKVSSELKSTKNDLINEFEIISSLSIPGVRSAIGKGIVENREAFCYDYFEGITLKEYLASSKRDIPDLLKTIINILKIIDGLHQSEVSHLSLTPENILVNPRTNEIQIIDFANSANVKSASSFDLSDLGSDLCYISPEQTGQISNRVDSRSDLYSLGIIFYEMFAGRTPFEYTGGAKAIHDHLVKIPASLSTLNKLIPESISQVIQKLLQKKPDERYQTASGLRYDIIKCLENYSKGETAAFRLGEKENYAQFSLSSKLYGREKENSMLSDCLKLVSDGANILFFIEGEPGVGKTTLIKHFKHQAEKRGCFFISGTSETSGQKKSNLAIITVLKELAVTLLSQSKTELTEWRSRMKRAVDGIGGLLNDLIPEFKYLIGDQPVESEMTADQFMNRINFLVLRIVQEVASKTRPLVLFFDDLHQADPSLFNIIQLLTKEKDIVYFMVIGCFRPEQKDNNNSPLSTVVAQLQS